MGTLGSLEDHKGFGALSQCTVPPVLGARTSTASTFHKTCQASDHLLAPENMSPQYMVSS